MDGYIGGYKCLTPMRTVGSGTARWCFASRGLNRYFMKEFLSPIYPPRVETPLQKRQMERCDRFEKRKLALYQAASCVLGDTLIPVIDFFQEGGHYYAITEAAPENSITGEETGKLPLPCRLRAALDVGLCLGRLHAQRIVHADLKPAHILLDPAGESYVTHLIDLDSGFPEETPPEHDEMEGDPSCMAPEAYRYMLGESVPLTCAMDTYSFGLVLHLLWTGEWPTLPEGCLSFCEATLRGIEIPLSEKLPAEVRALIRQMLSFKPEDRPGDGQIIRVLEKHYAAMQPGHSPPLDGNRPVNSLQSLWRGDQLL